MRAPCLPSAIPQRGGGSVRECGGGMSSVPGVRSERCKQHRLGSKLRRLLFVSTNPHPRLEQELIFVVRRLKSSEETAFSIKNLGRTF